MSQFAPQQFGSYMLVDRIATGGMAEIFRATRSGLGGFAKTVAIKRLHARFSEDPQFVRMLFDEARVTSLLQHSNVVQIHDIGRVDGHYYLALEYVDGRDLYQVLRALHHGGRTMPIDAACLITREICDGLHYAHLRRHPETLSPLNLVHRDISPQNILLSWSGEVKLADFGIVKADERSTETQAGVIKGKFYYMSPEQARGQPLDHRSDVFSLGIVLFESLTAAPLYDDLDERILMRRVQNGEVRSPREDRPEIPPELEAIVMRALTSDRARRYQSALELKRDLDVFVAQRSSTFVRTDLAAFLEELLRRDEPAAARDAHDVTVVAPAPATADVSEVQLDDEPTRSDARAIRRRPSLPAVPVVAPPPGSEALTTDIPSALIRERMAEHRARNEPAAAPPRVPAAAAAVALDDDPTRNLEPGLSGPAEPAARPERSARGTRVPRPVVSREHLVDRVRRRERRLKVALSLVVLAILGVTAGIAWVLFAPIPRANATPIVPARVPRRAAPELRAQRDRPVPRPLADSTEPSAARADPPRGDAELRIAAPAAGRSYRVYVDGVITDAEGGVVAVAAGRHTVRALIRPEQVWGPERVVILDPGAHLTVDLAPPEK